MLHPAGPEEEDDYEGEEEDQSEHFGEEEGEKDDEESVDIEAYKHAILELEGLKVSDSHTDTQHEDKESKGEDDEKPGIKCIAGTVEEREKGLNEELNVADDECPELLDLSASNKEFKPFRYENGYNNFRFKCKKKFGSISAAFGFPLQRLKQPSAHSRKQEDEDRQ